MLVKDNFSYRGIYYSVNNSIVNNLCVAHLNSGMYCYITVLISHKGFVEVTVNTALALFSRLIDGKVI